MTAALFLARGDRSAELAARIRAELLHGVGARGEREEGARPPPPTSFPAPRPPDDVTAMQMSAMWGAGARRAAGLSLAPRSRRRRSRPAPPLLSPLFPPLPIPRHGTTPPTPLSPPSLLFQHPEAGVNEVSAGQRAGTFILWGGGNCCVAPS